MYGYARVSTDGGNALTAPTARREKDSARLPPALLLTSLCLTDHANMQSGPISVLHRANDPFRLIAAGPGLGGLIPFILCVKRCRDPLMRQEAGLALGLVASVRTDRLFRK